MLDAKAALARAVLLGDFPEKIESLGVGPVADSVNGDGQAGLVRAPDVFLHLFARRDEDARAARLVDERLVHLGRAAAERAVHETFDAADFHPVIAETAFYS